MIIDSVSRWVSDRLIGGLVVREFNKTQEKTFFGLWFCLYTFVAVCFVILILVFSILTIKKKQIWLPEAITRILNFS